MIELKNVAKSYDKKGQNLIFDDVNLKIEQQSFVMLKGVSGAGKSTLLNLTAFNSLRVSRQLK